jgi:hypothetical protein
LNRAGIANEVPTDIMRAMWWKFMINVGINQASAVLRAPYGVFQVRRCPGADAVADDEVVALAEKAGIDLKEKDIDEWETILAGLLTDRQNLHAPGRGSRPKNRGGDFCRQGGCAGKPVSCPYAGQSDGSADHQGHPLNGFPGA